MTDVKKKKLLLIGWDAADWEHITPLLDAGKLPNLEKMINNGVMGNLATLQPILSPMLWNSIATGKQPYKHGIHGFVEPDPHHGGARPYSSCSRRTKAIWNMLSQKGYRTNVVNWWASHPAEPVRGCIVSNMFSSVQFDPNRGWKIPSRTIHPPEYAENLAPMRVFPTEFDWRQVLPFVPRAAEIDQNNDNRLSLLVNNLADMLTTHNVATAVMENTEWDFMAVYYTAIDHFCHSFMYYYPPKLPWIPQADFELYKDVIDGVYRFSDMTLARLLELAGPDTYVILCSDHGFQSRELRLRNQPNEPAGPAFWHRPYGIFVATGPGIKRDERVYGLSLLDITPTILKIFDLPVGEDMDGRALLEIFEEPGTIERIESWDKLDGDAGMVVEDAPNDPDEAEELFNQFVALGYVNAPGKSKDEDAANAEIECKYNLAKNLAWCGQGKEAAEIFRELIERSPWETRFIDQLIQTLITIQEFDQAEQVLRAAYDLEKTNNATIRFLWSEVLVGKRRFQEAYEVLSSQRIPGIGPNGLNHIANGFLKLRRFDEAQKMYEFALKLHPDNAIAHQGLSTIYCRQGMNQETVDHALAALALVYRLPKAHFNLGVALARSGQPDRAITAFETTIKFQPRFRNAYRWLALIYTSILPNEDLAAHYRKMAAQLGQAQVELSKNPSNPAAPIQLPKIPNEKERAELLEIHRPMPTNPAQLSGKTFVIVSGLPRSGTSLMMQILEAGGLPAKTDGERAADVDNPKGYYEWEKIKEVRRHPEIMNEPGLEDRAIKVISALLSDLPYQHRYKVIFMVRPIDEVVQSQNSMTQRLGTTLNELESEQLSRALLEHRTQAIEWLEKHPRLDLLVVEYNDLLQNPDPHISKIIEFLGPEKVNGFEAMRARIDKNLYRNRGSSNS